MTFQVKQLEEHFNTRLFERSHGKIALTPAGEVVRDYAERILTLSAEMETRMSELSGEVGGPLMVGASTTIAEFMLPRLLGEFKAKYPRVQARLQVANSETIENRVSDHSLDIGLIESPPHLSGLHSQVCWEDEMVVIVAPSHELAKSKAIAAQQLAQLPYVSREPGSGTREFADDYLKNAGIHSDDLNTVMELGSPEAVKGRCSGARRCGGRAVFPLLRHLMPQSFAPGHTSTGRWRLAPRLGPVKLSCGG